MQVTNHGRVNAADRARCITKSFLKWGRILAVVALAWGAGLEAVPAQDLTAIAKLDTAESSFSGTATDLKVVLGLSQPVPWRTRILADPPRLVMDFREVDFGAVSAVPIENEHIKAVRAGVFRPGWSRLVLELDGPYLIRLAEMGTGSAQVRVTVQLVAADTAAFARDAAKPEPAEWALPYATPSLPLDAAHKAGRLVVVLDPGHGGIDPGAQRNGQSEAAMMLAFGRQLKEILLREGLFDVIMTRDEDVFVPLETRISIARANHADVLISLHADALEEGEAVGAVIYTLSKDASNVAAATLAERHDRNDLLAGVNLTGQDDLVATVLMDMARTETAPRTQRLANELAAAMVSNTLKMHRIPLQSAGFSVLKSPDIPSVLIELGFLSSARDLARLTDPKWRNLMAESIRNGLLLWAQQDAVLKGLRQK